MSDGAVTVASDEPFEARLTQMIEAYRDAATTSGGDIMMYRPPAGSADKAVLKSAPMIRRRARDLVRNNPHAKNAVRMVNDAVAGTGVKLMLNIDWRTLGINDIGVAAEWQDNVVRLWESYAESIEFQADARRQSTFSELFSIIVRTDFTDGENLAIVEMKPGVGSFQTCMSLIDVDRLSNPQNAPDSKLLRGGIERDVYGEPLVYHIRDGHPYDVGLNYDHFKWQAVPRQTSWGRPIVLHTYDQQRPEQTRGVSEFASAIRETRMLGEYQETELETATTQSAYAAVIKTELDWSHAIQVLGGQAANVGDGANKIVDLVTAAMGVAADYHKGRNITFKGGKIPHLMPNESLDVLRSTHPNSNFEKFEAAFIRHLAAGLGVEAHELAKNYADVNYSAARSALLAVWRTYKSRRRRIVNQAAMPFFSAWLEEAVEIGAVQLPPGAPDFLTVRPYICRGTFIAWGKPQIDPFKERQAQQLGMQMGVETLADIAAEDGENWRDKLEQRAYEKDYRESLGLPDPIHGFEPGTFDQPAGKSEGDEE